MQLIAETLTFIMKIIFIGQIQISSYVITKSSAKLRTDLVISQNIHKVLYIYSCPFFCHWFKGERFLNPGPYLYVFVCAQYSFISCYVTLWGIVDRQNEVEMCLTTLQKH